MPTCSVSLAAMPSSSPVPYCKEKASPPCSYESDRKDLNFWCTPAQNRRYLGPEGRSWPLTHSPVQNWPRCRQGRFGFSYKEAINSLSPCRHPEYLVWGVIFFLKIWLLNGSRESKQTQHSRSYLLLPPRFIFTPFTHGAEGGQAAAAGEQAGGTREAFGAVPDPPLPNSRQLQRATFWTSSKFCSQVA